MSAPQNNVSLISLLLMMLVASCGESTTEKASTKNGGAISMAALLADPARYEDSMVTVRGFLVEAGTVKMLFFNSESIKSNIGKNAVRLDVSELSEGEARRLEVTSSTPCCTLKGTVVADDGGVNGLGSCTLLVTQINNVDR